MSLTNRSSTFDLQPSRLHQAIQGILLASVLTVSVAANAESTNNTGSVKRSYHISGGSLSQALRQFATNSGLLFSAEAKLTDGKTSAGLDGEYTVEEGFKKLLAGSGLTYTLTGNNSVAIKVADSKSDTVLNLSAVKVTGKAFYDYTNPYNKDYLLPNASTGTKVDTPIFDTPMSIQVVPKAVIADQQAIGLENVLKNVSGVAKGWGFGADANENMYIRGFASNNNIYRDGVLTPNTPISLANAERVEVLKGPSAMLYGRAQPGGLVNIVTKRPQTEAYYSLQQQVGSFDTYRTLLDATNKITQDGSLSYRLNYEHLDAGSFRDNHPTTRDFLAPSLTWKVTDKTQLDLDFIYQNVKAVTDSGIPYGLQLSGVIQGRIPINFSSNEPTDYANKESYTGGATLTHNFNQDWKVRAKFSTHNQVAPTAQTFFMGAADLLGNLNRGFFKSNDDFKNQYGTVDITGHFATGPLKHTVLLGSDYYHSSNANLSAFKGFWDGVPSINVFNPQYGYTGLSNTPLGGLNTTTNEWYGIYTQDQVSLWDKWHLLMGGRFDNAMSSNLDASGVVTNHTNDNNFSPRIGLLYQPVSWLGAYVNYVNGFNAFNQGRPLNGSSFQPERSKEMEFGLKGEWLDGKLRSTLAFYELTKTNVKTPLPAPLSNFSATTGAVRSRGIEFDLQGQLTEYWNVIGTYAYTEAMIVSGSDDPSSGIGATGNRLENIPRNASSLWSTYDFSKFGVQGFSAGAGVYLVGNRAANSANTFDLPGYGRVDTMLKYRHKVGPSNVTVQFNIENLLDKEYYASNNGAGNFVQQQTMPGASRTYMGSVKVEF